ncbi:MAG: MerR family transcriptional regulator [Deltaproteobacteria bacterium]|nr:MerR family transcriptional regulator [Deltaproteobacteria bacterium]
MPFKSSREPVRPGASVSSPSYLLPIGALSSLSGIPAETIRTWERRYELLAPQRDPSGRRLYDPGNVERLQLVSKLVEMGERVADLASLPNDELRKRRQLHGGAPEALPATIRAAVAHPTLGGILSGEVTEFGCKLEVVSTASDARGLAEAGPVDALVLDLAALGPDPASLVAELTARLNPRCTLVLYHFVSPAIRRALQRRSLRLVPAQIPLELLRRQVLDALLGEGLKPWPSLPATSRAPRFTRLELETLVNSRTELQCECPNHLAQLALALREFELYSRSCASQSRADAELHRNVANGTAAACAMMEDLLAKVCSYEGISR